MKAKTFKYCDLAGNQRTLSLSTKKLKEMIADAFQKTDADDIQDLWISTQEVTNYSLSAIASEVIFQIVSRDPVVHCDIDFAEEIESVFNSDSELRDFIIQELIHTLVRYPKLEETPMGFSIQLQTGDQRIYSYWITTLECEIFAMFDKALQRRVDGLVSSKVLDKMLKQKRSARDLTLVQTIKAINSIADERNALNPFGYDHFQNGRILATVEHALNMIRLVNSTGLVKGSRKQRQEILKNRLELLRALDRVLRPE